MLSARLPTASGYALCSDEHAARIAVATSERALTILDRATLSVVRTLGAPAHADRINELSFVSANLLYSASSDGVLKGWDPSSSAAAPVSQIRSDDGAEIWSVSVEPHLGHLIAMGTESGVVLWDVRRASAPLARYDVHTEAVTQVRFNPGGHGSPSLLSGSMDGLLCVIDCTCLDEDEAVVGIHNTESPITAAGFYGAASEAPASHAWALSSTDQLSLWDLQSASVLRLYDDLVPHRTAPGDLEDDAETGGAGGSSGGAADAGSTSAPEAPLAAAAAAVAEGSTTCGVGLGYIVGCQWDARASRLLMLGGQHGGGGYVYEVRAEGLRLVQTMPPAIKKGSTGHTDRIRAFHLSSSGSSSSCVTGAEDGLLCSWPAPPATAAAAATQVSKASIGASSTGGEAVAAVADEEGDGAVGKAKRSKEKDKARSKPY